MTTSTPLPVDPSFINWQGHRIATYAAGSGKPVLLVHSINAVASAYEMRFPFHALQDTYRVHAFDMLGFGLSDRPARQYSADDYIALVAHMLEQIGEPTLVIASSLGAAFTIAAAARAPQRVQALLLICPTGISLLAHPPSIKAWTIYRLLYESAGTVVFKLLSSRASIRYFLERQAYANPERIAPDMVESLHSFAQHPGARYAPICFVTNLLNCTITNAFASLTCPILIAWGSKAIITPLSQADDFLAYNRNAQLEVFENASMLLQDECPDKFAMVAKNFFAICT